MKNRIKYAGFVTHSNFVVHKTTLSAYLENIMFVRDERSSFVTGQVTLCVNKQKASDSSLTLVTTERSILV